MLATVYRLNFTHGTLAIESNIHTVPTGIGKSFSISTIYYYDANACMCNNNTRIYGMYSYLYKILGKYQIFTLSTLK